MPLNIKTIQSKRRAVLNIKKTTRAMEKVAAAKMHKAVERAVGSRPFSIELFKIVNFLAKHKELHYPFLKNNTETDKRLLLVISSNRSLCGGFNGNIFKAMKKYTAEKSGGVDVLAIGSYSKRYALKLELPVIHYLDFDDVIQKETIWPIFEKMIEEYSAGKYEAIDIIYTHYTSAFTQNVEKKQLLPLSLSEVEEYFKLVHGKDIVDEKQDVVIEPSSQEVFNFACVRFIENRIFRSMLESSASEHSSRMLAMKNATDNAGAIVDRLTVSYNRARQEAITKEIADIVSGSILFT